MHRNRSDTGMRNLQEKALLGGDAVVAKALLDRWEKLETGPGQRALYFHEEAGAEIYRLSQEGSIDAMELVARSGGANIPLSVLWGSYEAPTMGHWHSLTKDRDLEEVLALMTADSEPMPGAKAYVLLSGMDRDDFDFSVLRQLPEWRIGADEEYGSRLVSETFDHLEDKYPLRGKELADVLVPLMNRGAAAGKDIKTNRRNIQEAFTFFAQGLEGRRRHHRNAAQGLAAQRRSDPLDGGERLLPVRAARRRPRRIAPPSAPGPQRRAVRRGDPQLGVGRGARLRRGLQSPAPVEAASARRPQHGARSQQGAGRGRGRARAAVEGSADRLQRRFGRTRARRNWRRCCRR